MLLSTYVERLRNDLSAAAAAGGEEVQRAAERVAVAAGPALRLLLLDVLADAATEVEDLLGVEVAVRLGAGGEATFTAEGPPEPAPLPLDEGAEPTRLTLRLPPSLKEAAEQTAATAGLSVNAFLTQAVQRAVDRATGRGFDSPPATPGRSRSRVTGWARS